MHFFSTVLLSLLIAFPAVAGDGDTTDGGSALPFAVSLHQAEADAKRARHEKAQSMAQVLPQSWAPIPEPSPIDVLHYDLDLYLDVVRELVSGTATVDIAIAQDGLQVIELDVDLGLRVLGVVLLSNGTFPEDSPTALAFEHADDRLRINLPRALMAGETVQLMIPYGGHGSRFGDGINWSYHTGARSIYTFAEPFGARVWFPCNDRPDDKATVDLTVTAPSDLTVASNGLQVNRIENPDGTATTAWSSQYQVASYLVVMNLSDYAYREWTYETMDGSTMPVVAYLYPELADAGEADLAITPQMIETLASRFDEYPFVEEKYGNLTANFGGGMEHQTLTTIGNFFGNPWMEWLNVHELGHQWWGDWVTCDDWRELWLNESFATYSEFLWAEERYGREFVRQYAEDADGNHFFNGPLYDNPVAFSRTIYDKGGLILRMLRDAMGDDAFFAGLLAYREAFAEGSATTEELLTILETTSGTELDWFFDQWVYGSNRPRIQYDWQAISGPAVRLTVSQEHSNAPYFRIPMDVEITTTSGTERHRISLEAVAEQVIEVSLDATATGVELNPDGIVLCHLSHASEPDLDFGPDAPDLDAGQVWSGQTSTVVLPISNTGGSELVIDEIRTSSGSSFDVVSPSAFPMTLAAGDGFDLEVEFSTGSRGDQSDWILFFTNDPSYPDGLAYLPITGRGAQTENPRLLAPSSANAGTVPVGSFGQAAFTVLNYGASPLTLTADLVGSGFSFGSTVPSMIDGGDSAPIFIRFTPDSLGSHSATLTLLSNDPNSPEKQIQISGTGADSRRIEISPVPIGFGMAVVGATQSVTVSNSGTEALTVLDLHVEGPFAIYDSEIDNGTIIQPGASAEVSIVLGDGDAPDRRGSLVVTSDDRSVPRAIVPINAHAVEDEQAIEDWAFPAAASAPGLGGAQWRSRGFLLNPTDVDLVVDLSFRPPQGHNEPEPDLTLSLPALSQRSVADLVRATGHQGAGGIAVRASGSGFVGVSRTFSDEPEGTYGQYIPSLARDEALEGSRTYVLSGLAGNAGFHTNIGAFNYGGQSLALSYTLHGQDGTVLGSGSVNVEAGAFAQANEVFAHHTQELIRGGFAVISAADANARFAAYGSVVDDGSHDPTLIMPVELTDGSPARLIVPVIASNPGDNQTMWRSDVSVVNLGDQAVDIDLVFHPLGGSDPVEVNRAVEPGRALLLEDIVRQVFGTTGSGWLDLLPTGSGVAASSRTYNDAASGTFGQFVPAITETQLMGSGQAVVLGGLSSASGFRTNLGITSLADEETTFTITVYGDDGGLLGELSIPVAAGEFKQLTRILGQELGHFGTAWATIHSEDSGASFVAHASVVDGASGDPVYIPAAPLAMVEAPAP